MGQFINLIGANLKRAKTTWIHYFHCHFTWEKNTVRCVSLASSHIGNAGDLKKLPTYKQSHQKHK